METLRLLVVTADLVASTGTFGLIKGKVLVCVTSEAYLAREIFNNYWTKFEKIS